MKPVVELKNVTKIIGGKKIIDSISFSVYEGEVFGLLGPNWGRENDDDALDDRTDAHHLGRNFDKRGEHCQRL